MQDDICERVVRILIVSPQPIRRMGLAECLTRGKDADIVGEAGSGAEALERGALSPEVVILDANLRKPAATEVARALLDRIEALRGIVLITEQFSPPALHAACRAGIASIVDVESSAQVICAAVRAASFGDSYLVGAALRGLLTGTEHPANEKLLSPPAEATVSNVSPDSLSGRERQILSLIANGLTSREVASDLGISVRTVEAHRARIANKLGLRSIAELVRYAVHFELFNEK